jgi:hypothetical protein
MNKNISPIWKAYQGKDKKRGMCIVKGRKKKDPLLYLERYLDLKLIELLKDYKKANRFYTTRYAPDICAMCRYRIVDIETLLKKRSKK